MLTSRQTALLSAAIRHVGDARHLLAAPASPDQTWHLAGFGPECARKACLDDGMLDKVLGHDLGIGGEVLLEWWIPLDAAAWRYRLDGWADKEPRLAEWTPDHRYEQTGTRSGRPVEELAASAQRLLDRVVADLWTDGHLSTAAI